MRVLGCPPRAIENPCNFSQPSVFMDSQPLTENTILVPCWFNPYAHNLGIQRANCVFIGKKKERKKEREKNPHLSESGQFIPMALELANQKVTKNRTSALAGTHQVLLHNRHYVFLLLRHDRHRSRLAVFEAIHFLSPPSFFHDALFLDLTVDRFW